jgi:KaiC/GvpD/RAD55 family RecA-like ATPase
MAEKVKVLSGRVATGVPGFDGLVEGGFIKGSTVLLSGGTGTGKSMFAGHYMMTGALAGEKCVFISTEQPIAKLKPDWLRCGMDFTKFEGKNVFFEEVNPLEMSTLPRRLASILDSRKPDRIVIDSTTMLSLSVESQFELRKMFLQIISLLNKSASTAVLIEEAASMTQYSATGDVEYLVDGVVVLRYMEEMPEYKRHLLVRKMRRTKHSETRHPLQITDKGLVLLKLK